VTLEVSLQRAGHTVLGPIPHLDTALAALTGPPIDAALLDVHLSRGETVYPVADRLEEIGIPFGFMTAYQTDFIAARYAARPVVRKPCSEADLMGLVDALLRSRPDGAGPSVSPNADVKLSAKDGHNRPHSKATAHDPSERWKLGHAITLGFIAGAIAGALTVLL
jgi:hypothetical protein